MEADSKVKIEKLTKEFHLLIQYVTEERPGSRTAYEVESKLFREMLKLGNELLDLFFSEKRRVDLSSLSKQRMVRR